MTAPRTPSGGLSRWYIQLSDFERGKELGSGAFGEVYLATRISDGRRVAIKELKPFDDEVSQRNFIREITIPAELADPAIVPLIGFALRDEGPVIVSEFISNGALEQIAECSNTGDPYPVGFTNINFTIIFYGIAHALGALHKHKVFHRDLKPANVLLGDNYEPYLADFGLSRRSAEFRMTGNIGSPLFMAPEIMDETGEYNEKVDIYAYAMTVYFTLSDSPDYEYDGGLIIRTQSALMAAVFARKRPVRRASINDAYWGLISRCWAPDPADRPSADEICTELENPKYVLEPAQEAKFRAYVQKLKTAGQPQAAPPPRTKSPAPFVFTRRT